VVGHNPGLEELLEALTGLHEHLPTATLARVDLSIRRWAEVRTAAPGQLVHLWRLKELP
jgi:phosphohistidine phosphatase